MFPSRNEVRKMKMTQEGGAPMKIICYYKKSYVRIKFKSKQNSQKMCGGIFTIVKCFKAQFILRKFPQKIKFLQTFFRTSFLYEDTILNTNSIENL